LRERPELISGLIALAVTRMQLMTLRKLPGPLPGWPERIRDLNLKEWMLGVLDSELSGIEEAVHDWRRPASHIEHEAWWERVIRVVTLPYTRLCDGNDIARLRESHEALKTLHPCTMGERSRREDPALDVPWWNLSSAVGFSPFSVWNRLDRTLLERELTLLVMEYRRDGGLSSRESRSSSCAELSWLVSEPEPGAVEIRLDPPLEQQPEETTVYPLEYRSRCD
jgi:hypothetical protein